MKLLLPLALFLVGCDSAPYARQMKATAEDGDCAITYALDVRRETICEIRKIRLAIEAKK